MISAMNAWRRFINGGTAEADLVARLDANMLITGLRDDVPTARCSPRRLAARGSERLALDEFDRIRDEI